MKHADVVGALGALAQGTLLAVYRLLVMRGPEGFAAGEIGEKLEIPGPTLSFHLKQLVQAGLVSARKEIMNAVVWIDIPPPGMTWPANAEKVTMDQRGCVFVPRIVIVPVGGTVDFLNSDRLLHNIHSTPKLNVAFNRTQPKDRTIPVTFAKPEIVRVDCDLHSWMTAWVVVAPHPYYAVTKGDGQFSFDSLPPGSYRLQIWHERLGTVPAEVKVPENGNAALTVEMKVR